MQDPQKYKKGIIGSADNKFIFLSAGCLLKLSDEIFPAVTVPPGRRDRRQDKAGSHTVALESKIVHRL